MLIIFVIVGSSVGKISIKNPAGIGSKAHDFLGLFLMSIYPVAGCARRLKLLFNPTMTTNQNRSFNALLSMFVFWRSFTELNSLTKTLSKWTGKLCRVRINLSKCKYNPDSWQLLSLAAFTKDMKAGLLPNICELATTRIIVRGRIWFMLNFHTNSSRNRFDHDARCAFYIA